MSKKFKENDLVVVVKNNYDPENDVFIGSVQHVVKSSDDGYYLSQNITADEDELELVKLPKVLIVGDDTVQAQQRKVVAYAPDSKFPFIVQEEDDEYIGWQYARSLPLVEIPKKLIADKFGIEVEQLKVVD